jgi:hypothetical protein
VYCAFEKGARGIMLLEVLEYEPKICQAPDYSRVIRSEMGLINAESLL